MSWAAEIYRSVAHRSAKALAAGGATSSIAARRSVATGEVVFPVSDIDLLAVVHDEVAASGAKLAEFYQRLRWVRLLSPRQKHVEVESRPCCATTRRTRRALAAGCRQRMPRRGGGSGWATNNYWS